MKIVPDSMKPFQDSIQPAIKFELNYDAASDIIPLEITGHVYTVDGKFLSNISRMQPFNFAYNKEGDNSRREYESKIVHVDNGNSISRSNFRDEFMFTLDKRSLDYLEDFRKKNDKKDVILNVYLRLSSLRPLIRVGNYKNFRVEDKEYILSDLKNYSDSDTNLNILIADNNCDENKAHRLVQNIIQEFKIVYTIKSSDWVNDFQEHLGLGKFFILEIPKFRHVLNNMNNLSSDEKVFYERIEKSYSILADMEIDLRLGEWSNVVKKSRELLELFKKDVTRTINKVISQNNSISEDKSSYLSMSIDNLFAYANSLHHSVDRGKINDIYTGGKEDAYFAFIYSISIVNLLSNKFLKTIKIN